MMFSLNLWYVRTSNVISEAISSRARGNITGRRDWEWKKLKVRSIIRWKLWYYEHIAPKAAAAEITNTVTRMIQNWTREKELTSLEIVVETNCRAVWTVSAVRFELYDKIFFEFPSWSKLTHVSFSKARARFGISSKDQNSKRSQFLVECWGLEQVDLSWNYKELWGRGRRIFCDTLCSAQSCKLPFFSSAKMREFS
jgi:hypothetical protein